MLALPGIGSKVGFSGGVIAVGVRLAAVEPRITAAGLVAGSYVPRSMMDEAQRVRIPLHVLLQWHDEGNDRQAALELFDAFGSAEKTLVANMGGHTGAGMMRGGSLRGTWGGPRAEIEGGLRRLRNEVRPWRPRQPIT
ncbi:hypothetical protein [uncultured Microbacterium sp.]|uniref:hypothetical protein n=1 Tax=uncultured Microbacterium sp. TaxID=191216 RepID=UPI0025D92785|nr:hypothetical protein [uncultured Microbacterium sp.]